MEIKQIGRIKVGKKTFEIKKGDIVEIELNYLDDLILGRFFGFSTTLFGTRRIDLDIYSDSSNTNLLNYFKIKDIKSLRRLE